MLYQFDLNLFRYSKNKIVQYRSQVREKYLERLQNYWGLQGRSWPQFRQQIRPELLRKTFQNLHWVKSSDREVRSHRASQKKRKDRSSAPVNPPWLAPATAAAFPGSSQPGCCLKLSPPPKSPKAHNSSKHIVARVSPSKSSKLQQPRIG